MIKDLKLNSLLTFSIILLAALSRLIPHVPNFTPLVAMALMGGMFIENKKLAIQIPLLSMLISDCLLGMLFGFEYFFHSTTLFVYISFLLISLIGIYIKNNEKTGFIHTMFYSLICSTLFFLITNFGVWISLEYYEGLSGLLYTYILAIPFFGPTIYSGLFYGAILYSSLFLLNKKFAING